MKTICILFAAMFISMHTYSQNVGINATGVAPDSSAALDVSSVDRGVLIPRVSLSSANTYSPILVKPDTSLLVYNTATNGTTPNEVSPGFYYWSGNKWVRIADKTTSGSMGWFFDGAMGQSHANLATFQGHAIYENTGYNTRGIRIIGGGQSLLGTSSWATNFDFSKDFRLEFRVYIDGGGDALVISCGGNASHSASYSGYSMSYGTYPSQTQQVAVGTTELRNSQATSTPTGAIAGNWVTGRLEVFKDDHTGKKYIRSSYQVADDWVTAHIAEIVSDISPTGNIKFHAWAGSNATSAGFFLQNARLTYL